MHRQGHETTGFDQRDRESGSYPSPTARGNSNEPTQWVRLDPADRLVDQPVHDLLQRFDFIGTAGLGSAEDIELSVR